VAAVVSEASAPAGSGEPVYRRACAACHDTGKDGAPRRGDAEAWAWRLPYGREMLARHAREGWGDMPPRGGHPELTDAQVDAATAWLLSP